MKCIKRINGTEVIRVTDEAARTMVETKTWKYASKVEWKEAGRKRGINQQNAR